MDRKRIEWIDVAKGIGIILVVLGHVVDYGNPLFIWIYSFHMQLFFFLSGLVFNPHKPVAWKKLLSPAVITLAAGVLITMLIPEWRVAVTAKSILVSIYNGVLSQFHVNPIWFLLCLLWVQILSRFLCVNVKRTWKKAVVTTIGLMLGCIAVRKGFHLISAVTKIELIIKPPMIIGTAMLSMLFFLIGYFLRDQIMALSNKNSKILVLATASCFIIGGVSAAFNGNINLCDFRFNNIVLYMLESLSGLGIILLSVLLSGKAIWCKNVLMWLGKRTLPIMCIHYLLGDILLYFINVQTGKNYALNLIFDLNVKCLLLGIFTLILVVWYICCKKGVNRDKA